MKSLWDMIAEDVRSTTTLVAQEAPPEILEGDGGVRATLPGPAPRIERGLVRVLQVSSFVALLVLWQVAVDAGWGKELFFSKPTAVATFVGDNWNLLVDNTVVTMRATAFGFHRSERGAGIAVALVDGPLRPARSRAAAAGSRS